MTVPRRCNAFCSVVECFRLQPDIRPFYREEPIRPMAQQVFTKQACHTGSVFFQAPALEETGLVVHGFFTRHKRGQRSGPFTGLNFGFDRGQERDVVLEHYCTACRALGVDPHILVCSRQVHGDHIRIAHREEPGALTRPGDLPEGDALITAEPGRPLAVFYADCAPVLLLDPVRKIIAAVHSGWKGTALRIAAKTVAAMQREFGCSPEDIIAAVGPCIRPCHYQVGEDVCLAFGRDYGSDYQSFFLPENPDSVPGKVNVSGSDSPKYRLDLASAIRNTLVQAGLSVKHITDSGLCTACDPQLFYSHRRDGEQRGTHGAIIALRSERSAGGVLR